MAKQFWINLGNDGLALVEDLAGIFGLGQTFAKAVNSLTGEITSTGLATLINKIKAESNNKSIDLLNKAQRILTNLNSHVSGAARDLLSEYGKTLDRAITNATKNMSLAETKVSEAADAAANVSGIMNTVDRGNRAGTKAKQLEQVATTKATEARNLYNNAASALEQAIGGYNK